jgi:HEAT repeat protein
MSRVVICSVLLSVAIGATGLSAQSNAQSASELVAALRQFPAAIPGGAPSSGRPDPQEVKRRAIYEQLLTLGSAGMPTLIRGLADPDVQVRRNVALFLNAASGGWYGLPKPRLDIRTCLPALIAALSDRDARVRELSAQAIGTIGPVAVSAVPALITLLASSDEGSRNSACIGLAGIGPLADQALPALRKALADPSADVRSFAKRAIEAISK